MLIIGVDCCVISSMQLVFCFERSFVRHCNCYFYMSLVGRSSVSLCVAVIHNVSMVLSARGGHDFFLVCGSVVIENDLS